VLTEGAIAVDTFAKRVSKISDSEMEELRRMVARADWRDVTGRNYDTADVKFWEPCKRAFFIRMRAGGDIPRHHDAFIPGTTHHLVVQSNSECLNGWLDRKGKDRSMHMQEGHRYIVERSPIHWASNKGKTDRIHLLVEYER
jgi:aspartyl/asparaginyl beta-hydroxylase (cupin superfamily)